MYLHVQKQHCLFFFLNLKGHILKALPILHPLYLQKHLSIHTKNAGHAKELGNALCCACYVYSMMLDDEEKKRGKIPLPSLGKAAQLHYRECFLLVWELYLCVLMKRM